MERQHAPDSCHSGFSYTECQKRLTESPHPGTDTVPAPERQVLSAQPTISQGRVRPRFRPGFYIVNIFVFVPIQEAWQEETTL